MISSKLKIRLCTLIITKIIFKHFVLRKKRLKKLIWNFVFLLSRHNEGNHPLKRKRGDRKRGFQIGKYPITMVFPATCQALEWGSQSRTNTDNKQTNTKHWKFEPKEIIIKKRSLFSNFFFLGKQSAAKVRVWKPNRLRFGIEIA